MDAARLLAGVAGRTIGSRATVAARNADRIGLAALPLGRLAIAAIFASVGAGEARAVLQAADTALRVAALWVATHAQGHRHVVGKLTGDVTRAGQTACRISATAVLVFSAQVVGHAAAASGLADLHAGSGEG